MKSKGSIWVRFSLLQAGKRAENETKSFFYVDMSRRWSSIKIHCRSCFDRSTTWQTNQPIDSVPDQLTNWLTDRPTSRLTGRPTNQPTDTENGRIFVNIAEVLLCEGWTKKISDKFVLSDLHNSAQKSTTSVFFLHLNTNDNPVLFFQGPGSFAGWTTGLGARFLGLPFLLEADADDFRLTADCFRPFGNSAFLALISLLACFHLKHFESRYQLGALPWLSSTRRHYFSHIW